MKYADSHNLYLEYVLLANHFDGDVSSGMRETSWEDLCDRLLQHQVVNIKSAAPIIIPVKFKEDEESWVFSDATTSARPTVRNDANIESVTLAVFDLDKEGAREKAESLFKDFEYVLYSTASFSKEKPFKFRIVLPLEDPIPGEEWPDVFKKVMLAVDADQKCGNLSRVYYMPSTLRDADASPVSVYHHGKLPTKEAMLELADEYIAKEGLDASKLTTFNKFSLGSSAGVQNDSSIKHFAEGVVRKNERVFRDVDYSYEAMLERPGLKAAVDKYLKGDPEHQSRHYFALSVTNSEFKKFGEKADPHSIIQFIYRAAKDNGTPISHGNTGQELLEIVGSAIMKQAPAVFNKTYDGSLKVLADKILKEVREAELAEKTGNWTMGANRSQSTAVPDSYSYAELRSRHIMALKSYFADGDVLTLTKRVLDKEADVNAEKTDLLKVSEIIHKAAHGYFHVRQGLTDDALKEQLINVKQDILKNAESYFDDRFGHPKEKFEKYLSGALAVGQAIALNGQWTITNDKEQVGYGRSAG